MKSCFFKKLMLKLLLSFNCFVFFDIKIMRVTKKYIFYKWGEQMKIGSFIVGVATGMATMATVAIINPTVATWMQAKQYAVQPNTPTVLKSLAAQCYYVGLVDGGSLEHGKLYSLPGGERLFAESVKKVDESPHDTCGPQWTPIRAFESKPARITKDLIR
jgi:hypothetical protein